LERFLDVLANIAHLRTRRSLVTYIADWAFFTNSVRPAYCVLPLWFLPLPFNSGQFYIAVVSRLDWRADVLALVAPPRHYAHAPRTLLPLLPPAIAPVRWTFHWFVGFYSGLALYGACLYELRSFQWTLWYARVPPVRIILLGSFARDGWTRGDEQVAGRTQRTPLRTCSGSSLSVNAFACRLYCARVTTRDTHCRCHTPRLRAR